MTGSTRKRGKTWTAYWWVRNPEGQQVQRSKGGFATKRAAQGHLTTTLAAIGDGSYTEVTDRAITVGQYLQHQWLPSVRSAGTRSGEPRRASTVASYEVAVESWIVPHLGGVRLVALTPRAVESMLDTLAESGGKRGQPLSGRSRQYAYSTLRMAVDHAVKRGYLPRNPVAVVARPGATRRAMTSWTGAEAQAFLAGAANDRLYTAFVLFLARGPRRGELAGLRWSDVDLDAGTLRITRTRVSVGGAVVDSTPKTEAGRRTLHLDAGLVSVLRRHRAAQLEERLAAGAAWTDTGHVFVREDGTPCHPEHLSDRFERLCAATGVRRIRLHDARHTAASLMLADGTPVKVAAEMLGHANPAITQGIYQHVLPGMAEDAGTRHSAALGIVAT